MKKLIVLFTVTAMISSCKDKSLSYEEPSGVPVALIGNTAVAKAEKEKVVYAAPLKTEQVNYTSSNTNTAKKKGMSKAAKGAIIGGTTGAITGAIISKSGKGAIIGGVLGVVGTGYIIGRKKDKKDGRVD